MPETKTFELAVPTEGQPTRDYLRQTIAAGNMLEGWRGHGLVAQWLLDNGRVFERWSPLPARVKRGPMKACYRNALKLAQRPGGRYVYMEGYATHYIGTQHAWCYDRKTGLVVDPTWADGIDYIGVPVKAGYAAAMLRRNREPVLNWMDGYPIQTGECPVEVWREEI